MLRTYTELSTLDSFIDRFKYLQLNGQVGADTFGFDRYLNQTFYHSYEWRKIRDHVIIRDNGCDLGVPGYEINSRIYIHHMNPISLEDIEARVSDILNPEYLICCSHQTHNAIHYGSEELLPSEPVIRRPGDTKLW